MEMGARTENKAAPLLSRDGLRDYILQFQQFAGLPSTGELDPDTQLLMDRPRCGVGLAYQKKI